MIVIGLIGRIAAGKSTVARMFADHGAEVIDADALARAVLDEPAVRRAVGERFGPAVVARDGSIRRAALATLVFGPTDEQRVALEDLEAIVHPPVRRRIEARLDEIRCREAVGAEPVIVVLDVPLLVQSGWVSRCDHLVRVVCDDAVRRSRLEARNLSVEQQRDRDAAWSRRYHESDLPPQKAVTVDASGDLAYTRAQVDLIWSRVLRGAGGV
jgi:dephospho-CoA kinase